MKLMRGIVDVFRWRRREPDEDVRAIPLPLGLHRPALVVFVRGPHPIAIATGTAGTVVARTARAGWIALMVFLFAGGLLAVVTGGWVMLGLQGILAGQEPTMDGVTDLGRAMWIFERIIDAGRVAWVIAGTGMLLLGCCAARAERPGPGGAHGALGSRLDDPDNGAVIEAATFRALLLITATIGAGIATLGLTGDAPGWLQVLVDQRYGSTGG